MNELKGKTALVTGASRGIGEAAALAFAEAGASVVLAARTADQVSAIAARIEASGGQAEAVTCDVASYPAVEAAVMRATERFGRLDILVNNAGVIDPIGPLISSDPESWTGATAINANGVYNGLRAALPGMVARGAGVVVNISSGAANQPLEGWSHYCSAKAAAKMLTACADLEVQDTGVRVVGLSPGTVATYMQEAIRGSGVNPVSQLDWSRHIPPEWVGRAICWLCTDEAAGLRGTDVSLRDEAIRRRIGLG